MSTLNRSTWSRLKPGPTDVFQHVCRLTVVSGLEPSVWPCEAVATETATTEAATAEMALTKTANAETATTEAASLEVASLGGQLPWRFLPWGLSLLDVSSYGHLVLPALPTTPIFRAKALSCDGSFRITASWPLCNPDLLEPLAHGRCPSFNGAYPSRPCTRPSPGGGRDPPVLAERLTVPCSGPKPFYKQSLGRPGRAQDGRDPDGSQRHHSRTQAPVPLEDPGHNYIEPRSGSTSRPRSRARVAASLEATGRDYI